MAEVLRGCGDEGEVAASCHCCGDTTVTVVIRVT